MDFDYHEIDPSGMATQQRKWLEEQEKNPTVLFAKYCEEFPWAPECKIYDVWMQAPLCGCFLMVSYGSVHHTCQTTQTTLY